MTCSIRTAWRSFFIAALIGGALWVVSGTARVEAQQGPTLVDSNLRVRTVASGLVAPTTMAFLGPDDFLVLEKNTGQVKRVNGSVQSTVLDLAVNFAAERGLLGIALHPDFPDDPGVYLFWSCQAPPPPETSPFVPTQQRCTATPETGADTNQLLAVPLLGNRVDRFIWNGFALVFDRNLAMLRSFQNDAAPDPVGQDDAAQPARGNHKRRRARVRPGREAVHRRR
jgi:hypothetical protein